MEPQEVKPEIYWYVMQVMSGQENKVFERIRFECSQDMGNVIPEEDEKLAKYRAKFHGLLFNVYEINIPFEHVVERKEGKRIERDRKLFPGYVLIQMVYTPQVWQDLRERTKGIIGLIGGKNPVPLSDEEAEGMMRQQEEAADAGNQIKIPYNVGETVLIKDGVFEGSEAVIDAIDSERGRLKLSVNIFGRFTPVEVELWQVERPD